MDSNTITALATGLLAVVGFTQIKILITQNRQSQLGFIEEYRKRWLESRRDWGAIIFIGRYEDAYYQVVKEEIVKEFILLRDKTNSHSPSIWALDSARIVFTILSDICIKILKNQLNISDVYPIFGTELLRNSKPLRILLDNSYHDIYYQNDDSKHKQVRTEVQDWLIYHDGIRRRCLILIDLLWAEATHLDDLPPSDVKDAADAKNKSGNLNRKRLYNECVQLNGHLNFLTASKLSKFLKHSEYQVACSQIGINKNKLKKQEKEWTDRLLGKY